MKIFYILLLVLTIVRCTYIKSSERLTIEYKGSDILINFNGEKGYITIPFDTIEQLNEIKPAFCLDTTNNTIFIYVPSFGIRNYDLSSKKILYERQLSRRFHKRNHSFKLCIVDDNVVFISELQILVLNRNLDILANLRDTVEMNSCPNLALHDFEAAFIGDTLLFKAMFIDKHDFDKNKRYRRIYKDYEFILSHEKVICNNCDTCETKNILTKAQMDELLKNPY